MLGFVTKHYRESHYLYLQVSDRSQQLLSSTLTSALREVLVPGREFWESGTTLKHLAEADYFMDEKDREAGVKWPQALKKMMAEG